VLSCLVYTVFDITCHAGDIALIGKFVAGASSDWVVRKQHCDILALSPGIMD